MIGLLQAILCLLQNVVGAITAAIILAINSVVAGLAAILEAAALLLPGMPDLPEPPDAFDVGVSWVAWFFPVGTVVAIVTFLAAAMVVWYGVALLMRWARAL